MTLTGHRYGIFLHSLQKRGLRLGRRPVDFVGQDDVGKNGTFQELEIPLLIQRLGTHDVRRHQIGRELNAVEAQIH